MTTNLDAGCAGNRVEGWDHVEYKGWIWALVAVEEGGRSLKHATPAGGGILWVCAKRNLYVPPCPLTGISRNGTRRIR